MRLRLFRGVPSFAIFSSQSGFDDPGRCVRNLKAGRPAALQQIQAVFADALMYVATQLLPRNTDKTQVAEIVVNAFQSLWQHRESIEDPAGVKVFLNKVVVDACKRQNPSLDERSATLISAFSEVARVMMETERTLPQKYQRFYRMKFVVQQTDMEIAQELGITEDVVEKYTREVRAFMSTIPKWG